MNIIGRLMLIFFVFEIIYLWNRFVITFMVKRLTNFHKKYNSSNLHRQPIKFFIDNESYIIKYFGWFYWFGGVIIAIGLLFGELD